MAKKPFEPPKDITKWWQEAHCGSATDDPSEVCGFCGLTRFKCAELNSREIAKSHRQECDQACSGSGFWCYLCGRFWANDSCGECYDTDYHASDGAKLEPKGVNIHCCCGALLFSKVGEYEG